MDQRTASLLAGASGRVCCEQTNRHALANSSAPGVQATFVVFLIRHWIRIVVSVALARFRRLVGAPSATSKLFLIHQWITIVVSVALGVSWRGWSGWRTRALTRREGDLVPRKA
jgi:hypothetical protein